MLCHFVLSVSLKYLRQRKSVAHYQPSLSTDGLHSEHSKQPSSLNDPHTQQSRAATFLLPNTIVDLQSLQIGQRDAFYFKNSTSLTLLLPTFCHIFSHATFFTSPT